MRLYGYQHKRTQGQFHQTWNDLQQALRQRDDGLMLQVIDNRLLLDGKEIVAGEGGESFAKLLTASNLDSIRIAKGIRRDDFSRVARAFAADGSETAGLLKLISQNFGEQEEAPIRITAIKVAFEPASDSARTVQTGPSDEAANLQRLLLSEEGPFLPIRDLRQVVESLLHRGEQDTATSILRNYFGGLESTDLELRRKAALGLIQSSDLIAASAVDFFGTTIRRLAQALVAETDSELQTLLSKAFVRLSSQAGTRKQYGPLNDVCDSLDSIAQQRPGMGEELRPRIGVENRLPTFIEEALQLPQAPNELLSVLRRNPQAAAEHLAERFFRCMRREECDRMAQLVQELGPPGLQRLKEMLRDGQVREAVSAVGLLSRLDVPALLELLPARLPQWNRFYHDIVVRQIAYGSAHDRGRSLLELLELLDPLILPQAIDEIGMSGDRSAVPPLLVMAQAGDAEGRSALVQMKAVESLGRLREADSVPVLRNLLAAKKMWKWSHHRELRIAAAQALAKIEPRFATRVLSESGLDAGELAVAALDAAPSCPWVRQRRYERIVLRKPVAAVISSSWGRSEITVHELSLGGGMGRQQDNLRVGSEADIEISLGMRTVRGQVLLRRARVNEVGFELVNTDLESRYRLRRVLMDALGHAAELKEAEWEGQRNL